MSMVTSQYNTACDRIEIKAMAEIVRLFCQFFPTDAGAVSGSPQYHYVRSENPLYHYVQTNNHLHTNGNVNIKVHIYTTIM